jgi:hypothetical protein
MPLGGTLQARSRLPKLTRCAFQLIAATIKNADICAADRTTLTANFCSALYATNPNFKPERFKHACQPDGSGRGSMTAADKVLLHQCSCILLHGPSEDDISTVADALQILAGETQRDSIEAEYELLVNDAKRRGTL